MFYPFFLQSSSVSEKIFPIFGKNNIKDFLFLDLSDNSDWYKNLSFEERKNQKKFQKALNLKSKNLIISGYLENRKLMFETLGCKQMVEEKRFFHLGIDLTQPKDTQIFSPMDGEVFLSEYESGDGNYGGRVVLKHVFKNYFFYTLYGHLNPDKLPKIGEKTSAGSRIGILGDFDQNGGYWHHLHFQVITEEGRKNNFFDKGYCTEDQLPVISKYCPDPTFLFRF